LIFLALSTSNSLSNFAINSAGLFTGEGGDFFQFGNHLRIEVVEIFLQFILVRLELLDQSFPFLNIFLFILQMIFARLECGVPYWLIPLCVLCFPAPVRLLAQPLVFGFEQGLFLNPFALFFSASSSIRLADSSATRTFCSESCLRINK